MTQNCEFQSFQELLNFHNFNSKTLNEGAAMIVPELQSLNDDLKALVKICASVKPQVNKNIDQQDDKTDVRLTPLVHCNGLRFEEVVELQKIAWLNVRLDSIVNGLLLKVHWLQTVNSTMRLDRMSVHNVVATGEAPDKTFLMLWNAGAAYLTLQAVTSSLEKAQQIISNLDVSIAIFNSDLSGPKFIPKLLQLASEFLEKATKDMIDAMGRVKFSEAKKNDNS